MSVGAVNKQTGDRIPTAGMPAVDSVLSGTSTNPVQNKVVKEAFDSKQDTLTFDDTPTDGSNNPVKSNGIYDALANSANYIANTGVKNLIPIPFLYEDVSGDGLTYTINSDGTVEIDGTASATKRFYLIAISSNFIFEKGQTYTLTDGTSDSANDKYVLEMALFNGNTYVNRAFRTANGSVTFTLPTNIEYDRVTLYFVVYNGVQLSHKLFKPMVRYSAVKNADYVYAKTNKQLTEDVTLLDSKKADTDMVAADFNATASYTAGNYCIYEGKFYKFKASHSGAWSAADVDEIKIAGELSALKSGLTNLEYHQIKYFDVSVPGGVTSYNFSSDRPADYGSAVGAISIQGSGTLIAQMAVASSTLYLAESTTSQGMTVRIMYAVVDH